MPLNINLNLTLELGGLQQIAAPTLAAKLQFNSPDGNADSRQRTSARKISRPPMSRPEDGLSARQRDMILNTPSKADAIGFMPPRLPRGFAVRTCHNPSMF